MSTADTVPQFDPELDDPRSVQLAAAMRDEGVEPYEKVQVDYFAPTPDAITNLADGVSWVSHKTLMEGDRKRYLSSINKDMKIQKGTGDAILKLAAGEDRTALLRVAVTGWNLMRGGQPLAFDQRNLEFFLDHAPVSLLEQIENDVKKNNKWLFSDMSVEDIDEEIERLQELRVQVKEREAGNVG